MSMETDQNNKAVSDEQLAAALLASPTIKAAADAAGISERAFYDRMRHGNFQEVYKQTKAEVLRSAVVNLNEQVQSAVNTIAGIMKDRKNNPAIRLQAAQSILNNAGKFSERLDAAENAATEQAKENDSDILGR